MDDRFDAWWHSDHLTQTNPHSDDTPVYWAWEGWQAALSQDSTAPQDNVPGVSELPPLPEPLEISWPELHRGALGCGVEDRNIRDRYQAAEYGWEDGVGKAIECVPEKIYDADQMHEYARAALRAYGQRAAVAVLEVKNFQMARLARKHKCVIASGVDLDEADRFTMTSDVLAELVNEAAALYAAPSQPHQEAVPAEPSDEWSEFLKDGETPLKRLKREIADSNTLIALLAKERSRFQFLHSTNADRDGWEWGVARVRRNASGQIEYLWGLADHSDIDAAIAMSAAKEPGE